MSRTVQCCQLAVELGPELALPHFVNGLHGLLLLDVLGRRAEDTVLQGLGCVPLPGVDRGEVRRGEIVMAIAARPARWPGGTP
jgi:hypothetical protein